MLEPTLIGILAMTLLFAICSVRFARVLGTTNVVRLLLPLFILLAPTYIGFCFDLFPFIVLYSAIWAACLLVIGVSGKFSRRSILIANTMALCFMLASGMVFFGFLGIVEFSGISPGQASLNETFFVQRRIMLLCSLVLACLFMLALTRILKDFPSEKEADGALRPFSLFCAFGIVYEILDLIPLTFAVWFALMPHFLFGGTAILTLFCGVFAFVTAHSGAESFREAEHLALEQRKREQDQRIRLYLLQASVDSLTSLTTRRKGQELLDQLANEGVPYTVAFIDVNGLKKVNDTLGHAAGDAYLVAFAKTLNDTFPDEALIRWGGDEFLITSKTLDEKTLSERLAHMSPRAILEEHDTRPVNFCFGTTSALSHENPLEVLKRADNAMYQAKRRMRASAQDKPAVELTGVAL